MSFCPPSFSSPHRYPASSPVVWETMHSVVPLGTKQNVYTAIPPLASLSNSRFVILKHLPLSMRGGRSNKRGFPMPGDANPEHPPPARRLQSGCRPGEGHLNSGLALVWIKTAAIVAPGDHSHSDRRSCGKYFSEELVHINRMPLFKETTSC